MTLRAITNWGLPQARQETAEHRVPETAEHTEVHETAEHTACFSGVHRAPVAEAVGMLQVIMLDEELQPKRLNRSDPFQK